MDNRVQLACEIIGDELGEIVEKVARCLIYRGGQQTIPEIMQYTELEFSAIKNSLLVLIQQNLVTFEEQTPANAAKPITYYRISIDQVLMRLRFPQFVAHAKEVFGDPGEYIAEELLEHGRLKRHQVIHQACAAFHRMKAATMQITNEKEDEELFEKTFQNMVRRWFILHVDTATSETAKTTTTTPSSTKGKTSAPSSTNLFILPTAGTPDHAATAEVALKDNTTYWRLNPEKFLIQFRNRACISLVAEKFDSRAAQILSVIFDLCETYFRFPKEDKSAVVSARDIYRELRRRNIFLSASTKKKSSKSTRKSASKKKTSTVKEERPHKRRRKEAPAGSDEERGSDGKEGDAESDEDDEIATAEKSTLRQYLDLMCSDTLGALAKVGIDTAAVDHELGFASYQIQLSSIVGVLQQKIIESIVADKFGMASLRIFRLVNIKRMLDQKQISEMAMLPAKETKERLYRMLSADVVCLQEVPRTTTHEASRTFHLWTVKQGQVKRNFICEMWKTLRNLRMRLHHESNKYKEILAKMAALGSHGPERLRKLSEEVAKATASASVDADGDIEMTDESTTQGDSDVVRRVTERMRVIEDRLVTSIMQDYGHSIATLKSLPPHWQSER